MEEGPTGPADGPRSVRALSYTAFQGSGPVLSSVPLCGPPPPLPFFLSFFKLDLGVQQPFTSLGSNVRIDLDVSKDGRSFKELRRVVDAC